MRVLYWTELFWPHIGGVEVLSQQLISALQKRGHEFIVVTSHSGLKLPDEARYNGIRICRFPFQKALVERNLGEMKVIAERVATLKQTFKPDLIHINSSQPSGFFHQHTIAAYPASTLFTVHEPPAFASGYNTLVGRLLHSAQWVVAVSEAMLLQARRLAPEIKPRSSVIYNSLELPTVQPAPLLFDPPCLLCIGRVIADKGFDLALDAFRHVIERFPRARLLIVGDGPARPELEDQAGRLELANAVDFPGWIPPEQVPELMNTATVVVVPSRWSEPFGLVAVQAAQMARPVVATRVGGLPEVVVHQQTGLLVEKENSTALAEQITLLLQQPERATQLGQAARSRAQELFSMERFVDNYDALYQRLSLARRTAKAAEQ